jgi:hypothetical protein
VKADYLSKDSLVSPGKVKPTSPAGNEKSVTDIFQESERNISGK